MAEVDLVNWLFLVTSKGLLEVADLVVLVHCVPRQEVGVEGRAELVVRIHIDFFLQLTPHILVSIIAPQLLVQLREFILWLLRPRALLLLFLFPLVLGLDVSLVNFLSVGVELDHQIMLLGSCDGHFK